MYPIRPRIGDSEPSLVSACLTRSGLERRIPVQFRVRDVASRLGCRAYRRGLGLVLDRNTLLLLQALTAQSEASAFAGQMSSKSGAQAGTGRTQKDQRHCAPHFAQHLTCRSDIFGI